MMADYDNLRQQYHALITRMHEIFDGVDESVAFTRPVPGRWSMAECIAHLNVTGAPYLERLTHVHEQGNREDLPRRKPTKHPGFFVRRIIWSLEPPYRMKVKTFTQFEPQEGSGLEQTLRTFERQQHDFLTLIDAFTHDGVPRLRVQSPAQPLLRLYADDWMLFLAAHARRHLWQAERVHHECE
ncbi:DinB family protein [bacterium]|nr:DinB family protein [bacterium]